MEIDNIEEYEKVLLGGLVQVYISFQLYLEEGIDLSEECQIEIKGLIGIHDTFQTTMKGYCDPHSFKVYRSIAKGEYNKGSVQLAVFQIHLFGQALAKDIAFFFGIQTEKKINEMLEKFSIPEQKQIEEAS